MQKMRFTFCLTVIITSQLQDTFKRIKAVDNIELDTGNKWKKLKKLLLDQSFKSLKIFDKYIMECLKPVQQEKRRACPIPYILNSISGTLQLSC